MKASTILGTCMAPSIVRGWFRKSFHISNRGNQWHRIIIQPTQGPTQYRFLCQQNTPIDPPTWKQNTNFGIFDL